MGSDFSSFTLARVPTIDSAIAAGQIYVELQPIVDLATGQTFGYESLARSTNEAFPTPMQLFATAQEQGAIGRLSRELRRLAVTAAHGATLFLNVHPTELDDEDLIVANDPLTQHTGQLVIEIPEASPIVRHKFAHAILTTLRARGIQIALDDFGAGYSNFSYITQLAPDLVKLDRALVAGVTMHSRQQKLLQSLNALCLTQGATVIAEGIETRDELTAVMAAGIPLAQGYYLGRPSRTGASTWTPS